MINKLSPENAPAKILLSTAERIGDTLFELPTIQLFKKSLPDVQFDVLAFSPLAVKVFERNPHVGQVRLATSPFQARQIIAEYPLTINLMSEMLKKIGKTPKQNFYSIGLPDLTVHRAQQALDYGRSLLAAPSTEITLDYEIFPTNDHVEKVKALLAEQHVNLDKDILIACQLGCHRVARRGWKFWNRKRHEHKKVWRIEDYAELAQRLMAHNSNIKIVLTGAPSERFLAKMFLEQCPNVIDLIGKTSVHELAALLSLLKVLVTHDTGTLHLACAQQTPLVALFGPTPVSFSAPFPMRPQYTVLYKDSMADISVTEVYQAVLNTLNTPAR